MNNNDVSIFVLTCDKYSDLWDDFFALKEMFWPNCPYDSYLITEEKDYRREGVITLCCGSGTMWGERFRRAVESVSSKYIILFLDDFFICKPIDNDLVNDDLSIMEDQHVSYLRMGDTFGTMKRMKCPVFVRKHLITIPKTQKYGVSTSEAIWDKSYLLELLGDGKVSAWQFELDRCEEASSDKGMAGYLLYDNRDPLNVTKIPVVIQGKFYPRALKFFKSLGYEIKVGERPIMTKKEVLRYDFIDRVYRIRFARGFIKRIGKLLGMKFVS